LAYKRSRRKIRKRRRRITYYLLYMLIWDGIGWEK